VGNVNDGEFGVMGISGSSGRLGDGGGWSREEEAIDSGAREGGIVDDGEYVRQVKIGLQSSFILRLTWLVSIVWLVYGRYCE
jgi:hypothetical protein